ncbi:hypothetical protein E3N88_11194 [Mikania micrantha]|uniref:Uncharacterized protein n=1 Tax=Mikania micrantha TaxID=192012 RepID=A0A5N6PD15_9ASTR|nr:hypothetical protein E3N88_11194 [Mikania micrantha]
MEKSVKFDEGYGKRSYGGSPSAHKAVKIGAIVIDQVVELHQTRLCSHASSRFMFHLHLHNYFRQRRRTRDDRQPYTAVVRTEVSRCVGCRKEKGMFDRILLPVWSSVLRGALRPQEIEPSDRYNDGDVGGCEVDKAARLVGSDGRVEIVESRIRGTVTMFSEGTESY